MGKQNGTAKTIVIIAIVLILAFLIFNWLNTRWQINVSASPEEAGIVYPSGLQYTKRDTPLTVYAEANPGWSFNTWILDGETYSYTPTITLPAQTLNVKHNLSAIFVVNQPMFTISPNMQFTAGSKSQNVHFTLSNTGPNTIENIRIKLNDNYNIFSSVPIHYRTDYGGTYSPSIYYYTEALNVYTNHFLWENLGGSTLTPYTQKTFTCGGYVYGYSGYVSYKYLTVNSNVESGTYNLSWSLTYSVIGDQTIPTQITIPWTVTIVG